MSSLPVTALARDCYAAIILLGQEKSQRTGSRTVQEQRTGRVPSLQSHLPSERGGGGRRDGGGRHGG